MSNKSGISIYLFVNKITQTNFIRITMLIFYRFISDDMATLITNLKSLHVRTSSYHNRVDLFSTAVAAVLFHSRIFSR